MLRASVLLIYFYMLSVSATQLPVIAIDYPPFTTESDPKGGIAFTLLDNALQDSGLSLKPAYWSPARAHKLVREGDWCASFYPPMEPSKLHIIIGLADEPISLGLFRRRQNSPFEWTKLSELEGKTVAHLRALARDGIGKKMTEAGMEIFNVETVKQGLQLLDRGRVDYAFGDSVSGKVIMASLNIEPEQYQFSTTVFRALPVGVWLNLNCQVAVTASIYLQQAGYQQLNVK